MASDEDYAAMAYARDPTGNAHLKPHVDRMIAREQAANSLARPCPWEFTYEGDFTIAARSDGRRYRVLLASGTPKARFCLLPLDHRGSRVWVDSDFGWIAEFEIAEEKRRAMFLATPARRARESFGADTI